MIWISSFSPREISFVFFVEGEDFLLEFLNLSRSD